MIKDVKLIGVCVGDPDRSLDFYTNKLGFKVLSDTMSGDDIRWIEVAPPDSKVVLALYTPPGMEDQVGKSWGIEFKCDDVRATYEELQKRGVKFVQELEEQSWGTSAVFLDPDGNSFVIGS
jgi:predicted enzyme related to lactoylglutathione lyase